MRLRAVLLTISVTLMVGTQALAAPAERSTSNVWRFSDGLPVAGATSSLVRTDSGVSMTIRTWGLAAGDAVTVWWVIFNNPEECTSGEPPFRCGEPDIFDPAVETSVQRAAGRIVGGSGGYATASYIAEGDVSGCIADEFLCVGLFDAREADVHLIVRSHGPALPEFLPEQFRSFGAACGNVPPELGGGGPNTCEDLQFAVHETV